MNPLLPKNFDLDRHLKTFPVNENAFHHFDNDKANYILTLLTLLPVQNKQLSIEVECMEAYTPLSSTLLQSVVHNYRQYLNYFIESGVIETDGHYICQHFQPGESKCYGYRFTKKYRNQTIKYGHYSDKFNLLLVKKKKKDFARLHSKYSHLTKWLWPQCALKIDSEIAMKYLVTKRNAQKANLFLLDRKLNKIGVTTTKDPDIQYKHAMLNVMNLSRGVINCTVDDTVKRMHYELTSLKSELRNLITYKDERLISIDITNSQPYLVLALFNKRVHKIIKTTLLFKQLLPMLENTPQLIDNEDVKRFVSFVSNEDGIPTDLYSYMMVESEKYGIHYSNRREVKTAMLTVFFSGNGHHSKTKKLFKILFPTINEIFEKIKSEQKNLLACLLQTIESYVVLQVITKRIAIKYPNAPIFTIHDSVVTTEKYVNDVKRIMCEELTNLTGYPPKLKVDEWAPENLDWTMYQDGPFEINVEM